MQPAGSLLPSASAFLMMILAGSSISLLLTSCEHDPRQTVSFNNGWRFVRFGTTPGSNPEPSGYIQTVVPSASSEGIPRNGAVAHILDDDLNTCWNSAYRNNQWVAVDFREPHEVSGIKAVWGFSGAPGVTVDIRDEAKRWKNIVKLPDNGKEKELKVDFPETVKTTGVRLNLVRLPKKGWPRIAKLVIYGSDGLPLDLRKQRNTGISPSDPAFDDSSWQKVTLPHDWGITGPFSNKLDHATGLLPWKGIGWYRKHFRIPASDAGKFIYLDFDGAMANAEVFLNGKKVGGWPYGYNSFRVDLTPGIKFGEDNIVAVRLDTEHWGSRWYPGAGIYRNVRIVKTSPVHIAHWGVAVTTPKVSADKAVANFAVTVDNNSENRHSLTVQAFLKAPDGSLFRTEPVSASAAPGKSAQLNLSAEIANPKLWSIQTPDLYTAELIVKSDGKVTDSYPVTFGIRSLKFTPRDGFYLNGKRVQIKGVCNHHDLGPLGAAVNRRAIERQLEILKEMGCNAIRTSHNPPAPELLELCDRMGFLVMDEAFDCWKRGKRQHDYSDLFDKWRRKDLEAMVKRDRNHPCVILWSIGNEVPDQFDAAMAKELRDIVHNIDPTRPVVLASNKGKVGLSPVAQALDVMGYNYNLGSYKNFLARKENANIPLVGSETVSCISSRGEYFFPINKNKRADFQVTSYDLDFPGWGCPPDKQFEMLDRYPAVLGEFVWTGFDYLGEPTPYNSDSSVLLNFSDPAERERQKKRLASLGSIDVPSRSSYFGIIDLCGFPKDRYYIYQARWRPDYPMVHILPHWNWPDRVGKVTPVHVYTSGDEVELFLNGKSLGRKKKGEYEYRLRWDDVVYQPGELKAVAYRGGKKWAEETVKTTGKPFALLLAPDRKVINADGLDLVFVTLRVLDKEGVPVPTADVPVTFSVKGPGEIVATGNGNSASHELFQSAERKTFNGLALAIVRFKPGASTGEVRIKAVSPGLAPAETVISAK